MIGLALHLGAVAVDVARAEVAEWRRLAGWGLVFAGLGRGTPDPSEVDQLAAECDALRGERDEARAQLAELREAAATAVAKGQLYEEGACSEADARAAGCALATLLLARG